MKEIHLANGRGTALVDDEDFEWLSKYKWARSSTGYATRGVRVKDKCVAYLMHREIMKSPRGSVTDHINHDRSDNRKINLRVITPSQNVMNTLKLTYSSSGFRGVSAQVSQADWWQAKYQGKYLGCGKGESGKIQCAMLRDLAALRYEGPLARLNFPIDGIELLDKHHAERSAGVA